MKYLSFALAAGLLLASCAHPNTPPPPQAEPIGLDSPIPLRLQRRRGIGMGAAGQQ